jgi:hypothetical protein
MRFSLNTPVRAEFVGTAFRLAEVVGSGIVGERLSVGMLRRPLPQHWENWRLGVADEISILGTMERWSTRPRIGMRKPSPPGSGFADVGVGASQLLRQQLEHDGGFRQDAGLQTGLFVGSEP